VLTAGSCPVPGYLPALARPVLPWARRHVARVARRYGTSIDDLWDETVTALLRAAVYFKPTAGAFAPYAHTAIHRACWRYVIRQAAKRPPMVPLGAFAGFDLMHTSYRALLGRIDGRTAEEVERELAWPSAEEEVIAREAAHRAWLLREHAVIASSRGDIDTTTRLLDAATVAATVARAVRRRPRRVRA
jgi:hypothetical protein